MNKYNSSQIYIVKYEDMIYLGSTTKTKEERLRTHINCFNSYKNTQRNHYSIFKILEKTLTPTIKTIQQLNLETEQQLVDAERYYMNLYKIIYGKQLINDRLLLTPQEIIENQKKSIKKYFSKEKNKEKRRKYQKKYRKTHNKLYFDKKKINSIYKSIILSKNQLNILENLLKKKIKIINSPYKFKKLPVYKLKFLEKHFRKIIKKNT